MAAEWILKASLDVVLRRDCVTSKLKETVDPACMVGDSGVVV